VLLLFLTLPLLRKKKKGLTDRRKVGHHVLHRKKGRGEHYLPSTGRSDKPNDWEKKGGEKKSRGTRDSCVPLAGKKGKGGGEEQVMSRMVAARASQKKKKKKGRGDREEKMCGGASFVAIL